MTSKKKSSAVKSSESLIDQYVQRYLDARPDPTEYEQFVNEQMKAFDEHEQKRNEELDRMANEPDADGFVTVVSKRPAILEEAEETEAKTSKKAKELPNFYKFQQAQQGRNQLEDLRSKFEEDRRRIEELKKSKLLQ